MKTPGLLFAGTSSDAGKSLLVAGLCRAYARRGIKVAPFKAQNMSNNSMVCQDGSEIGRAQYLQALAAGITPSSLLNPVLLKPGTDRRSHIVLRGQPYGTLEAGQYATGRTTLRDAAWATYRELAAEYDLILAEGAGSPAEINLRAGDYVNLGLAQEFSLPTIVIGDIDRGGILAALYGTWALVSDSDRKLLKGFIINKFRGDQSVLDPGLAEITKRTGLPFYGVMPWLTEVWLDGEDALAFAKWPRVPGNYGSLRIAVIDFPRISNATDLDALAAEPGVELSISHSPAVIAEADLVILPGSRATVGDLAWLRKHHLDQALAKRAAANKPILGICGGYQMLGEVIDDPVECVAGAVPGLGLLPTRTDFLPEKQLNIVSGSWVSSSDVKIPVNGYEIHHGKVSLLPTAEIAESPDKRVARFLDGYRCGNTFGSLWHGIMECDDFRRAFLREIAQSAGIPWRPEPQALGFRQRRENMLENLADACEQHLDIEGLLQLAQRGI